MAWRNTRKSWKYERDRAGKSADDKDDKEKIDSITPFLFKCWSKQIQRWQGWKWTHDILRKKEQGNDKGDNDDKEEVEAATRSPDCYTSAHPPPCGYQILRVWSLIIESQTFYILVRWSYQIKPQYLPNISQFWGWSMVHVMMMHWMANINMTFRKESPN